MFFTPLLTSLPSLALKFITYCLDCAFELFRRHELDAYRTSTDSLYRMLYPLLNLRVEESDQSFAVNDYKILRGMY